MEKASALGALGALGQASEVPEVPEAPEASGAGATFSAHILEAWPDHPAAPEDLWQPELGAGAVAGDPAR